MIIYNSNAKDIIRYFVSSNYVTAYVQEVL